MCPLPNCSADSTGINGPKLIMKKHKVLTSIVWLADYLFCIFCFDYIYKAFVSTYFNCHFVMPVTQM